MLHDGSRAYAFGYYVLRWLRPQINWNAALWPATIARLTPEFLDLLGYYTGNIEAQIPNGRRAAVGAARGGQGQTTVYFDTVVRPHAGRLKPLRESGATSQ